MRFNLAALILVVICNIAISQTGETNLQPQKRVTIDCTKIEDTLAVYTEKIFDIRDVAVIGNNKKQRMFEFALMNDSIGYFTNYNQSGELLLYKINLKLKKFSPFGETGMGPGEFLGIISIKSIPDKFLYVVDNIGKKIQKLDPEGNFISSAFVPEFYVNHYSISKDYNYISRPKEKDELFLASIYDSAGREIKKIAPVAEKMPDFFSGDGIRGYIILSDEKSDYIWIISQFEPIIRKYDYEGNFLCEYKLIVKENQAQSKPQAPPGLKMTVFTSPITHAAIVDNETIICNLNYHGMVLLNLGLVENEKKNAKMVQVTPKVPDFIKTFIKYKGKFYFIGHFSILKEL